MPEGLTQAGRHIAITTELGEDVLLLRDFTCTEAMSSLYHIDANVMAEARHEPNITAKKLVGKPVSIVLHATYGKRYFQGIVRSLTVTGKEERFNYYALDIVPQLWRLTQITDCRIFQQLSVPDIISKVFGDLGISDYQFNLTGQYRPWDYCVMYRESYWDFLSRLMEEEGIYYYWVHDDEKVMLKLGDDVDSIEECAPKGRYMPEGGTVENRTEDVVESWLSEEQLTPGSYSVRDFNFQLPGQSLEGSEPSFVSVGDNNKHTLYDYPAGSSQKFKQPDERLGEISQESGSIAKRRMESIECEYAVSRGTSMCRTWSPGKYFELTRHFRSSLNGKYTILSLSHTVQQAPTYETNEMPREPYRNSFTCMPHAVLFRPPRRTHVPRMYGPQTAMVVGPPGEEIYPDKYGRVKVKFHWDRYCHNDDTDSCWIRVATPWAGTQWGMIHLPRIGHEVVVHFIDGDPDQPIIIGSVYNADNMPPYKLPDEATKSGVKSRSSKQGGESNFNEIRFEDKKGSEEIHVHAERNLRTMVEAAEIRTVGATRTTTVQKDDTYTNKEGNVYVTVEKENRKTTIKKDDFLTLEEGTLTINIVQKDIDISVQKGNMTTDVTLGSQKTNVPAGTMQVDAKDIKQSATMSVEIKANTTIRLSCGASSIEMNPGLITISAPMVRIN